MQNIIAELLDIDSNTVSENSYLIRDLEVESIDLLELAVSINKEFSIEVKDEEIFLKSLRRYLLEADESGHDTAVYLGVKYPFLPKTRITEIIDSIDLGPVLMVKDLIYYIEAKHNG